MTPSGSPGGSSGASARLRSISSMKNGLPAVRPCSVRASAESPTSAAVSASSSPDSATRCTASSRLRSASSRAGAASRSASASRRVTSTISGEPCRRRTTWRRSSSVGRPAHCRSSTTSSSGRAAAACGEHGRDGLEEPVAAVLALAARRFRGRAELGDERREVGCGGRAARVGGVVAQRLHERLVGHHGLLVDAPVQHRRAARVGRGGEAGRQPRLADAGLAGQDDDAALRAPALAQHRQLGLAADERALLQPLEDDAGAGPRTPVAGAAAGARLRRQQALVEGGDLRRGRRAELVAQQHPQLVVDAQRLGDVAARRERLHQRAVARLAVGLAHDQRARRPLGRRQLGRPEPQRRARERLERVRAQLLELGAALVDPAARELGQQRALEAVERRARPLRRAPRIGRAERRLRVGRRRARLLDVERDVGQHEPQAAPALDGVGAERAPQARQQRGDPGVGRARRAVLPDRVDQLVAAHRALAVEREIREQEPPLAAGQVSLDPAPVDLDGQGAAQLDTCGHGPPRTVTAARVQDTPNTLAAASSRSSAAR